MRIWISAAFLLGNRYPKRDLGTPGLVVSNTTRLTKFGSLMDGTPRSPKRSAMRVT
jgi:hypothetical protein